MSKGTCFSVDYLNNTGRRFLALRFLTALSLLCLKFLPLVYPHGGQLRGSVRDNELSAWVTYLLLFSCSVMSDSAAPWVVACQPPLLWDFPGKKTGVGCHFLLQGIFPTQGSTPYLLHWQVDSLPSSHLGSLNSLLELLTSAPENRRN